jgi:type II secretory pathway pseudopilin PulG
LGRRAFLHVHGFNRLAIGSPIAVGYCVNRKPTQVWTDDRGIATSLIEATLVIIIAAILSGVALLTTGDQLSASNETQGIAEVKLIGLSVLSFMQDTGHAPAFLAGDQIDAASPVAALLVTEGADPADPTGTWPLATGVRDTLENQIVRNNPGASTKGYARKGEIPYARFQGWNGPYMSRIPASDPWGDRYLVTAGFATSQGAAAANLPSERRPAVFVISAGPNRALDTQYLQAAEEFVEGGDDMIFRIQ